MNHDDEVRKAPFLLSAPLLLAYHREAVNEDHRQDVGDQSWSHRVKKSRGTAHRFVGGCMRLISSECS